MTEALKAPTHAELYQQLQALPEHLTGEIIGGELVVSPRPVIRHARTSVKMDRSLSGFDQPSGEPPMVGGWWILAEPELHLGDDVLVPDLAGWKREALPELPDAAYIDVTPEWVCEILSPRTARRDRGDKARSYHRAGVMWRWLVDPALRTLEVYRREGAFWVLLGTYEGDAQVRAEPFDAVALDMSAWWEGVKRTE